MLHSLRTSILPNTRRHHCSLPARSVRSLKSIQFLHPRRVVCYVRLDENPSGSEAKRRRSIRQWGHSSLLRDGYVILKRFAVGRSIGGWCWLSSRKRLVEEKRAYPRVPNDAVSVCRARDENRVDSRWRGGDKRQRVYRTHRRKRSCRRVGSAARQNKALARRVTPPPPRALSLSRALFLSRSLASRFERHRRSSATIRVCPLVTRCLLVNPRDCDPWTTPPSCRPENTTRLAREATQTKLRRAHCQSMRRAVAPNKGTPLSPLLFLRRRCLLGLLDERSRVSGLFCVGAICDGRGPTWITAEKCVGRGSRLDIIGWKGEGGDDGGPVPHGPVLRIVLTQSVASCLLPIIARAEHGGQNVRDGGVMVVVVVEAIPVAAATRPAELASRSQ